MITVAKEGDATVQLTMGLEVEQDIEEEPEVLRRGNDDQSSTTRSPS